MPKNCGAGILQRESISNYKNFCRHNNNTQRYQVIHNQCLQARSTVMLEGKKVTVFNRNEKSGASRFFLCQNSPFDTCLPFLVLQN